MGIVMTELGLWVKMGVGRLTALSLELECSKQNVAQLVLSVSHKDPIALSKAIENIEAREKRQNRCCKNNVLGAAKYTQHKNEQVRKKAQFELIRWSEYYAITR